VTSAAHAEPARSHLNEMILLGPTVHLHQWRAPCRPTHRQPKAMPTDSLGAALRDVCYTTEEHCMCTPARAAAAGTRSSRRGRSSCSKASTHPARPRRRAVGSGDSARETAADLFGLFSPTTGPNGASSESVSACARVPPTTKWRLDRAHA
jgi:hypothetical protein